MGTKIKVDSAGNLETTIKLASGLNSWEIVVRDASGNEVRYPMQIVLDKNPPQLKWMGPDTVSAAQGNWKIPLEESNIRGVSLEPNKNSLIAASDSIILLTLQNLVPGVNNFTIHVEDAAGNQTKLPIKVYFLDERSRIVQSVSPKAEPEVITKIDTVYRCTTSVERPIEPEQEECPEVAPLTQTPEVYQIRYRLRYGETLRSVADKFYGNRELYIVIAEQNNILDPEEWYKLPVGKSLWIPIWKSFEYGRVSAKKSIQQYHQKVKK